MMAKCPAQSEDFYVSSFLSGLRADIQQALYIYKPQNLQDVIDKAKEQGILIDLMEKRLKTNTRLQHSTASSQKTGVGTSTLKPWQRSGVQPSTWSQNSDEKAAPKINLNTGFNNTTPVIKRISPTEMAKRREKGRCYNCDETYSSGHKCSRP